MNAVDYILDGLEAALELERELGVRAVEIDRGVLVAQEPPAPRGLLPQGEAVGHETRDLRRETGAVADGRDARRVSGGGPQQAARSPAGRTVEPSGVQSSLDLVFVHDRPLSAAGAEMMAKILNALGKPNAPIVVAPPISKAKITVVLGGLALRKYFPGMKGGPGQWQKTPDGRDVLITYSPEYILRFGEVTPAVEKIKQDMWRSLKAVRQRLA